MEISTESEDLYKKWGSHYIGNQIDCITTQRCQYETNSQIQNFYQTELLYFLYYSINDHDLFYRLR